MKKNALIVCEYNPFHNGHFYHIAQTRAAGAQTIVCLMSGNFVQRGEIAFCEKALRAEMAIRCGADLVLELPLPFVLSGARYFALGAAKIAKALQIEATLSFGALANLEQLTDLRREIDDPSVAAAVSALCEDLHYSYPRALQTVVQKKRGENYGDLLRDPNSLLALEYLRAFRAFAPDYDFFALEREARYAHDADIADGSFASAMFIRGAFDSKNISEAIAAVTSYVPSQVADILYSAAEKGALPLRRDLFSAVAMTRLLSLNEAQLRNVNGIRQGLENRIVSALKTENDLNALYDAVKSKRYTHAGIRQSLVSAVLGITRADLQEELPYLRVLGMNANGRAFLREQKSVASCPFVMNLSEAPVCRLRTLDEIAGRITAMCKPERRPNETEYSVKPFVLNE